MAKKTGGESGTKERVKKECPVTKEEFMAGAKPLTVSINGVPMVAAPKQFSTGSFGWYLTGKTAIEVNGTPVEVQIGMNLTAVGSKNGNGA